MDSNNEIIEDEETEIKILTQLDKKELLLRNIHALNILKILGINEFIRWNNNYTTISYSNVKSSLEEYLNHHRSQIETIFKFDLDIDVKSANKITNQVFGIKVAVKDELIHVKSKFIIPVTDNISKSLLLNNITDDKVRLAILNNIVNQDIEFYHAMNILEKVGATNHIRNDFIYKTKGNFNRVNQYCYDNKIINGSLITEKILDVKIGYLGNDEFQIESKYIMENVSRLIWPAKPNEYCEDLVHLRPTCDWSIDAITRYKNKINIINTNKE